MKPATQCTTMHVGNPGFDVMSVTAARAQTGPASFPPATIFGSSQPEPSSLPQRLYVLVTKTPSKRRNGQFTTLLRIHEWDSLI